MNITANLLNEIEDSISNLPILKVIGTNWQLDKTATEINAAVENNFIILLYLQIGSGWVYTTQKDLVSEWGDLYIASSKALRFTQDNDIVSYIQILM